MLLIELITMTCSSKQTHNHQRVHINSHTLGPWAETWRRFWGGPKKYFVVQFQEKFAFSGSKFLMTFFLVIDLVLRIFPFFSHIFRMFTMLTVVYDHFLIRKNHFSLCSYFHAHPTTLLLKILGGPMHGPSPTSNFGGTVPPVPPRS